jgi:putative glutamine amidotransferase
MTGSKKILTIRGTRSLPAESVPYEEAIRVAGIEPVVADPEAGASLAGISGLLLMGGTDVNPALYCEERRPETDEPDDLRDALECSLIAEALELDMPVLAICRGLQILNVQHGGTLAQHLEPVDRHRRRTPDKSLPVHAIKIVPGSRLADIAAGDLRWDVNSRHHQAVARLGDGLRVSATDPADGMIEAAERPDKSFVVAVQWHPENQSPVRVDQARLFRAFAEACGQFG